MNIKKYKLTDLDSTYPELSDRLFTDAQLEKMYRDIINKDEYHDFSEWFQDMKKSGLIVEEEV